MKIGKPIAIKRITMSPLDSALSQLPAGHALPVRCANAKERKSLVMAFYYAKRTKSPRYGGAADFNIRQSGMDVYFMKEGRG